MQNYKKAVIVLALWSLRILWWDHCLCRWLVRW